MTVRRQLLRAAVALAVAAASAGAAAQADYPKGTVTIIVPFPPGGPTDVLTRIVAARLQDTWQQPVVVDYKPGAGTMLGAQAVARAPADGSTIGVVVPAFTINPVIQKKLIYEPKDLTGVTQLARFPIAIAANASAPFETLAELVSYAKRNPGKLTFATPGIGGTSHLAGELLNKAAGIDLVHVPYKGSAPAHTDVIGGRVDLMIDPLFSLMPHVNSGRMKVVAVATTQRVRGFEKYPPVAESYAGFDVSAIIGFVVPAGTPPAVIDKIQRDTAQALKHPADRKRFEELGMDIVGSTPREWNAVLASETAKWGKLIRDAKIPMMD
jgi:tripartite-type tricarboxylate transporter receptor subunit TctC